MYVSLWFWGPGLRMLCVRSMRNTEARPDCSQPASQPSRPSQSSLTHAHPHPALLLRPQPRPPKNQNQDCQNIDRKCFRGRVYLASTATTWLAGSDIFTYNIYIYMCVCVCVFVWARMWCAVAAEPIVCSERPGMNNL